MLLIKLSKFFNQEQHLIMVQFMTSLDSEKHFTFYKNRGFGNVIRITHLLDSNQSHRMFMTYLQVVMILITTFITQIIDV